MICSLCARLAPDGMRADYSVLNPQAYRPVEARARSIRYLLYCSAAPLRLQGGNESDTALPTMLCAARTQVVMPHWLLGVFELSDCTSPYSMEEDSMLCSVESDDALEWLKQFEVYQRTPDRRNLVTDGRSCSIIQKVAEEFRGGNSMRKYELSTRRSSGQSPRKSLATKKRGARMRPIL